MEKNLPVINPETADKLRDLQHKADLKIVREMANRIEKLESKLEELKTENVRLEAWLKSEKHTYRLQYFGPGGRI
jgi:hypothetical protein